MENKTEESKKDVLMNETKISEPKISTKVKESIVKKEKKVLSREEKIKELSEKLFNEAKKTNKMFIALSDKNRNYWNSGDELHLIIVQGRCKEMPEDITPVLQHALSEGNKLLKEATELEVKLEMDLRAEEHLISVGNIKTKKKESKPFSL